MKKQTFQTLCRQTMRYFKQAGIYKASNVTFNPTKIEAYSYRWWRFVEVINGEVVFNSYHYSNSTIKHQYKVRRLMASLGINIDVEIDCPKGLQNLESALDHYKYEIEQLELAMAKPRSHKAKNAERYNQIQQIKVKVRAVNRLIKARDNAETEERRRIARAELKARKKTPHLALV